MSLLGMTVNNPNVQEPLETALAAVKTCGPSREFSIVRTKIEEALLWLKAAERAEFTEHAPPHPKHYPVGMGDESRRLHREYNALVKAQAAGAKNGPEVVRLTDECSEKGIILVPGGESL